MYVRTIVWRRDQMTRYRAVALTQSAVNRRQSSCTSCSYSSCPVIVLCCDQVLVAVFIVITIFMMRRATTQRPPALATYRQCTTTLLCVRRAVISTGSVHYWVLRHFVIGKCSLQVIRCSTHSHLLVLIPVLRTRCPVNDPRVGLGHYWYSHLISYSCIFLSSCSQSIFFQTVVKCLVSELWSLNYSGCIPIV